MRMNRLQWQGFISRLLPARAKRKKAETTRRPLTRYKATVGKKVITAKALTKSEARADMKRRLGLPRLPAGTRLVES